MYSSLRATSGCISPSNLKSTFFFFKISTASLICFVLLVIGWPKVEWDKKATFGSKPNNLATLDAEIAISDNCSEFGYSCTLVSAIKTVLPLFTIIFIPNIISPGRGSITFFTFSKDCPYLLEFPVTIASASPQATMHEPHITRSSLTILSQSRSKSPSFLWSLLNRKLLYFFLFSFKVEFTISISKFSPYPISLSFSFTTFSLATNIGVPSPLFLKDIAALSVFSSSPSAKTTFLLVFFIWLFIPCMIVTDGSNLCFSCSEYWLKLSIFFLATPDLIAAFATATGITLINLGSNVDGIIYSLP